MKLEKWKVIQRYIDSNGCRASFVGFGVHLDFFLDQALDVQRALLTTLMKRGDTPKVLVSGRITDGRPVRNTGWNSE